ncbi:GlsB/YeaQ/YmgE family stress response membrane protein [Aureispira anguillae]|uniref:GlsB/YeaQ/YmgE family stress response membrane protein n=1 Tax=Aureispira anguillae TaxID=2864201 RepID=A0A915YFA5_9BACT|nr:GlsB/YeaQ/YmgE family stress response membrane protein [Aureispira anguillae]BDS12080.1 GlsB/YeaQ/YmgE family stress response membrane protein [Aureispira anguillae]
MYALIIGGIAGWLASNFMKGKGMGIIMNVILGIIGAFVGVFVFGLLGITIDGILGDIARPTCGAIIVLFIARVLAK